MMVLILCLILLTSTTYFKVCPNFPFSEPCPRWLVVCVTFLKDTSGAAVQVKSSGSSSDMTIISDSTGGLAISCTLSCWLGSLQTSTVSMTDSVAKETLCWVLVISGPISGTLSVTGSFSFPSHVWCLSRSLELISVGVSSSITLVASVFMFSFVFASSSAPCTHDSPGLTFGSSNCHNCSRQDSSLPKSIIGSSSM
uniref:Secreted protein n=1 Tax=Anopheles darlingi TaxID=43151 RepID=A0A2M4D2G0_ANODA